MFKSVSQITEGLESKTIGCIPSDGVKSIWKSKNTPFWFEYHADDFWYAVISDEDVWENNIFPEFNNPIVPHKTMKQAVSYAQHFLYSQGEETSVRPLYRSLGKVYKIKDMHLYLARNTEGKWYFYYNYGKYRLLALKKFNSSSSAEADIKTYENIKKQLETVELITNNDSSSPQHLFNSRNKALQHLLSIAEEQKEQNVFEALLDYKSTN